MKKSQTNPKSLGAPAPPNSRRDYEPPRLTRCGHMAQVTRKTGASDDNSQTWPSKQ